MGGSAYDLVVIGGGPGGYVAAAYAARRGLSVACVEREAVGGVCLHRGCIPSKALIRSAELLELAGSSAELGVVVEGKPTFDLAVAMRRKTQVVGRLHKGVQSLLKSVGVVTVRGHGRLDPDGRVIVSGEGGETALDAEHVIVATGSEPRLLPGMEADGSAIITSDHALEMERIPASIIILGAGAIGMEFAYILSTFGAEVTVLELLPRPLPLEDEDVSAEIQRLYRKRCRIMCGIRVTAAERTAAGVSVAAEDADGTPARYEAEQLLVAIGRKPLSAGLGLEECGVRVERDRVQVDGAMRTDNPRVFAIGDVVGRLPLAHTASAEGHVAVDAILGQPVRELVYSAIPRATYCIPEVASVGLTGAEALASGADAVAAKTTFRSIGKAVASGEYEGFCKVVADRATGALLGIHIVGPHATELIGEASLAMAMRATVGDMAHAVHAHPTLSEILMETAAQLGM
jgi:dihydrolipoamide dehydrogenase